MTKTKKKSESEERWIYIGRRVSAMALDKGKKAVRFAYINENTAPGFSVDDEHWFFKPLHNRRGSLGDIIGSVYSVTVERKENGGMLASNTSWLGQSDRSDEEIINWEAQDINAKATLDRDRDFKKAKKADPILDCLEPIRKAYHRTNANGKRALIAKILEYLGR